MGHKKKGRGSRTGKENAGFVEDYPSRGSSRVASMHEDPSTPKALESRKQVDPEIAKYFSEISNVLEGGNVDERSAICGNALEETRGKELELATDYIISHTLQSLLENCDVDHLCGFLQRCAYDFPSIAMDKSGSHVAETALKSLEFHLQNKEDRSAIEETLITICKVVAVSSADVMCNCYGSHVLRSLLCLSKGVPLNSTEFHSTKSSTVLAARFNIKPHQVDVDESSHLQQGFPDLFKFLALELLKHARTNILLLQVNQCSSLVLQTALKLLVGYDEELLHMIPVILGCKQEKIAEGSLIEISAVKDILDRMKETSFCRLMEVILEVAPKTLYNEIFMKVFRNSLYEIASHHCGNFVVQALVSHANCAAQMELFWEELGSKFKDLLEMGRSGVVASLLAASQRLHKLEEECCRALIAAVGSENESPRSIVPRILFLDSFFGCEDPSNWNWAYGAKIHIMGSLILQVIFRFPRGFMHSYITSISSLEADHVLQVAKDVGGARVIEAFLDSNAKDQQKRKLISRLQGHFGELSMHTAGSFTVEKCFTNSNSSLREIIVSELASGRTELSKTKHGLHLLRKLDVDRFAARPEEWRSRLASRESVYQKFYAAFGSNDSIPPKGKFGASHQKNMKEMRREVEQPLASCAPQFKSADSGLNKRSLETSTGTIHEKKSTQSGKKTKRHRTDSLSPAS